MKLPHILTISISAACVATICLLAPLSAASTEETKQPSPPTKEEATELYEKAAAFLRKAVDVESDDLATAHCVYRGRFTRIEWRNLVFRQLILGSISAKDQKNGIHRRIYAQLDSESHRLIDEFGASEWRSGQFQGFPSFVVIEEVGDQLRISAPGIDQFAPSPGQLAALPASSTDGDEALVAKRF